MRVLLAFAGSRGDAQPGVLLGRELAARGHCVTVAVSPNLVGFAEQHGVTAVGFGLDSAELLRAQHSDRAVGLNPVARFRALVDLQRCGFAEAARDLIAVTEDAELIVTGMACEEVAAEAARRAGIPLAAVHFFPIRPNRVVPVVPTAAGARVPGVVNRLGWRALAKLRAWALMPEIAAVRAGGGDEPLVRTAIQAYDTELFPGLAAELGDAPVVGFPVVPGPVGPSCLPPASSLAVIAGQGFPVTDSRGAELLPGSAAALGAAGVTGIPAVSDLTGAEMDLQAWLDAGSAPVYVGFGSMPVGDARALEVLARGACQRQGRRLLLSGSAFRAGLSREVAVVDQVDHRAVLPRCAVAVHHGGAGTTAAALRAGVPSVICSVQADQPFWGRQLETLGLGVTMPFADLSVERLERLLIRATEPSVVAWAAAYGASFRDDGVARAADIIESLVPPAYAASLPHGSAATITIGGAR